MAYVQQTCEGYNKKTLMGNWYEEKLYPQQPFRQNLTKAPRNKEEDIACLDGKGFQRALPSLSRRTKWDTRNRIILDDGIKPDVTVMKAQYPNAEQQISTQEMKRPFDKTSANVASTSIHPHSQVKANQRLYRMDGSEAHNQRDILMYGSDFKSTLPQHARQQKYTNYASEYKGRFPSNEDNTMRARTQSEFNQKQIPAGNYRQVQLEQTVKPITTLFCQNKKEEGDQKERTAVQRSWVPQKDKALSFSMGRTAEQFKKMGVPTNDIQTSLNMNKGVHSLQPVGVADNYFRHVRSVTVQPNNTFCNRP